MTKEYTILQDWLVFDWGVSIRKSLVTYKVSLKKSQLVYVGSCDRWKSVPLPSLYQPQLTI